MIDLKNISQSDAYSIKSRGESGLWGGRTCTIYREGEGGFHPPNTFLQCIPQLKKKTF
jgi:hypothetical protein